jgi:hypothetical protein
MAKGDWPKSYVIPSLAISVTAAGFLIWHLLDPAKVDGRTITLLVIVFLPWLRTIFESIEFPGGGSVTWRREVEAEQKRQAAEIEALRFLLARFLSEDEREILQKFASGQPITLPEHTPSIDSLLQMKLLEEKPEILEIARSGRPVDAETYNETIRITASGRQYLDLISKLPADAE